MSYDWLDKKLPRPARSLVDIPGGTSSVPDGRRKEAIDHRSLHEILKEQAYWPIGAPGHLHTLVLTRFTGPVRDLIEFFREANHPSKPIEEVADAFMEKYGSDDAIRTSLLSVCSEHGIRIVYQGLPEEKMEKLFRSEILHIDAMGGHVFTDDVPPQTINPFGPTKGGTA